MYAQPAAPLSVRTAYRFCQVVLSEFKRSAQGPKHLTGRAKKKKYVGTRGIYKETPLTAV